MSSRSGEEENAEYAGADAYRGEPPRAGGIHPAGPGGKQFPEDLLPAKYRAKGVRFTPEGYPDFSPHAKQLPNGKNHVEIEYTGSRSSDAVEANKNAGLSREVKGYTWHHVEDGKTMYLVPTKLHEAVRHTGGTSTYRHARGAGRYGD